MKKILPIFAFLTLAASSAMACKNLEVSNEWVKPTMPGKNLTAAFFDLKNTGDKPVKLIKVNMAGSVAEMHNTIEENGVFKMRQIDAVEVPAGSTINFKPRSLHIMLTKLEKPLQEGEKVKLTLAFDNKETCEVNVAVKGKNTETDGHAHH